MSGALLERVRLSAYLVLAVLLGSAVWILDAAWGWSFGGWLTLRFGFHDSIASAVVHGVCRRVHARGPVQPRTADRQVHEGGLSPHLQTPQHPYDPDGADADLHRLLRLLRRLPGDRLDHLPRLGQHLPQPDDPGLDRDDHHLRLRRRLHRRLLRQSRRSVLDGFRRPCGGDQRLGGRGCVRAHARIPDRCGFGGPGRVGRQLDRDQDARRRRRRGCGGARFRGLPRDHLGGRVRGRAIRPASTTSRARSAAS